MPTPRPMNAAMIGAVLGTSMPCVSRSIAKIALPSARTAEISGMAIATNEPNASSMTIAAAMRPISSLNDVEGLSSCPIAAPPNSTFRESVRSFEPMSTTFWMLSLSRLWLSLVKVTVAYAVSPSRLICAAPVGPNGLVTAPTSGTFATSASIWSNSARTAGAVTLPSVVCTTMVLVSPEVRLNCDASS